MLYFSHLRLQWCFASLFIAALFAVVEVEDTKSFLISYSCNLSVMRRNIILIKSLLNCITAISDKASCRCRVMSERLRDCWTHRQKCESTCHYTLLILFSLDDRTQSWTSHRTSLSRRRRKIIHTVHCVMGWCAFYDFSCSHGFFSSPAPHKYWTAHKLQ